MILTINPIYSILNLISIIVSLAIILFSLKFAFLPDILLIIYIGAVLILFWFLVMIININAFYKKKKRKINCLYALIFLKVLMLFQLIMSFGS